MIIKINIRDKIKTGNIVTYKNNKYIVIDEDIICGGNIMVIEMIKLDTSKNWFGFKKIYKLYDDQIENCIIN